MASESDVKVSSLGSEVAEDDDAASAAALLSEEHGADNASDATHADGFPPVLPEDLLVSEQKGAQDLQLQLRDDWVPDLMAVVEAKLQEFLALLQSTDGLEINVDAVTKSWCKLP